MHWEPTLLWAGGGMGIVLVQRPMLSVPSICSCRPGGSEDEGVRLTRMINKGGSYTKSGIAYLIPRLTWPQQVANSKSWTSIFRLGTKDVPCSGAMYQLICPNVWEAKTGLNYTNCARWAIRWQLWLNLCSVSRCSGSQKAASSSHSFYCFHLLVYEERCRRCQRWFMRVVCCTDPNSPRTSLSHYSQTISVCAHTPAWLIPI